MNVITFCREVPETLKSFMEENGPTIESFAYSVPDCFGMAEKNETNIGSLYFITDGVFVKIGRVYGGAGFIERRIKQIETGNPREIEKIVVFETNNFAAKHLESVFHEWFKDARVRGEWYDILWAFPRQRVLSMPPEGKWYPHWAENIKRRSASA